jgi:hypothetical protein
VFATHDCFEGQIQKRQDLVDKLDWAGGEVDPATGRASLRFNQKGFMG